MQFILTSNKCFPYIHQHILLILCVNLMAKNLLSPDTGMGVDGEPKSQSHRYELLELLYAHQPVEVTFG